MKNASERQTRPPNNNTKSRQAETSALTRQRPRWRLIASPLPANPNNSQETRNIKNTNPRFFSCSQDQLRERVKPLADFSVSS